MLVFLQPEKRVYGYVNGVFFSMLLHNTHNLIRKFLRLAVPSNLFKLLYRPVSLKPSFLIDSVTVAWR